MKTKFISSSVAKSNLLQNIWRAVIAGGWGYVLFLGVLFTTKAVSMLLQEDGGIVYEAIDFVLPIIGFLLLFLIKILENYKNH